MNRPTTVCDALASVPRQLEIQGITFEPHIFYNREHHDGTHDVRFCYALVDTGRMVEALQPHPGSWLNPYAKGYRQDFLYLIEHIENDAGLVAAILETREWLLANTIILSKDYPAFSD